jgi:hypothetical protein
MNLNYTICSTSAQVRHAAPVVFPVDFDGDEHVYRVHPINVQLFNPVIMPAKEEHGCDSGSESLDKHEMLRNFVDIVLFVMPI